MDKSSWGSISEDAKSKWDTIDAKDKATILGVRTKRAEKSSGKRSINNAEIGDGASDEDDQESEAEPKDTTGQREVNETKSLSEVNEAKGSAHPADIRRVLGKGASGDTKKAPRKQGAANHVTWNVSTIRRRSPVTDKKEYEQHELFDDDDSLEPQEPNEMNSWGVEEDMAGEFDTEESNLTSLATHLKPGPDELDEYWDETQDQFFRQGEWL